MVAITYVKEFLMNDGSKPCLTINGVYEIVQESGNSVSIIDDTGCVHSFYTNQDFFKECFTVECENE